MKVSFPLGFEGRGFYCCCFLIGPQGEKESLGSLKKSLVFASPKLYKPGFFFFFKHISLRMKSF